MGQGWGSLTSCSMREKVESSKTVVIENAIELQLEAIAEARKKSLLEAQIGSKTARAQINMKALEELESARRKTGISHIPYIGLFTGRLSMKDLLEYWSKHDVKGRGRIPMAQAKILLKDILFSIPEMIRKSGKYTLQPFKDLALVTKDEIVKEETIECYKELRDLVEPTLMQLQDRLKLIPQEHLDDMLELMCSQFDLNNDGYLDKEEFLVAFLPPEALKELSEVRVEEEAKEEDDQARLRREHEERILREANATRFDEGADAPAATSTVTNPSTASAPAPSAA